MPVTVLDRPDGSTTTTSPTLTTPLDTMPAKPRKSWFGLFTHCTGSRKGSAVRSRSTGTRLEVLHQRRPLVPGHLLAAREHVVAVDRRHRDRDHVLDPDLRGERPIVAPRCRRATSAE